jgi:hypothetical protein
MEILRDNAPSQATVYRWPAELKRGRQSTEDEHRSGHPVEACTDDYVELILDMILKDR